MVGLPACGGLARLWWARPPRRRRARTNSLRFTVRYGKLTLPGETEAGKPGEEPIAPTGTFRSAERRAKGYPVRLIKTMTPVVRQERRGSNPLTPPSNSSD